MCLMYIGEFKENETNEVNLRDIQYDFVCALDMTAVVTRMLFVIVLFVRSSHTLIRVCQYMQYKVRYTNSSTEIPEFKIAPEIALDLLMAANFLDC